MPDIEQHFYKFTVLHWRVVDDNEELETSSGLTFGKTFNEVCAKLTDYFGEDTIEEMKVEFVSDCDVLEENEIKEIFNNTKEGENKT